MMTVAAKTRGDTTSVTKGAQVIMNSIGTFMLKNTDEISRLQSEVQEEWIRQVKGERLHGAVNG